MIRRFKNGEASFRDCDWGPGGGGVDTIEKRALFVCALRAHV